MKILYALNGVFANGGTESVILNYYNNIDRERFHIDFLLHGFEKENTENKTHKFLLSQGSKIYYVTPRGVDYRKNRSELRDFFSAHRGPNSYDIVHSHMDAAGAFVLAEAKRAGIKVRAAHSHNTQHQINKGSTLKNFAYKALLDRMRKKTSKLATLRIGCSDEAGKWLFGTFPYEVLKNAVDTSAYSYNKALRDEVRKKAGLTDSLVVGHIGRMAYQKNHEYLLDIFANLSKSNDNARLLLVGDGELRPEIERKIDTLGLASRVLLLGNRSDVPALLQAMDILVLPSRFEGLPVVLVEAQAAGLPCLASDAVSRASNVAGLVHFIPLNASPDVWAKQIEKACESHIRRNMTDELTASGYNIRAEASRLEALYGGALNDRSN